MGVWIDIEPVNGGFEYKVGQLIVARSRWVKRQNNWRLKLITLKQCQERSFGILAAEEHSQTFTPTEIMQFLQDVTTREITGPPAESSGPRQQSQEAVDGTQD
jgi:hypothetical protein